MSRSRSMNSRSLLAALVCVLPFLSLGTVGAAESTASPPQARPQPPARPLLYFFEHFSLRRAAFLFEPEVELLITRPASQRAAFAGLFTKAAQYAAGVPTFKPDTVLADIALFVPQLGFETFRENAYTIHVVRMPPPESSPEVHFAAIVYKDGEDLVSGTMAPSTRFITLEKTTMAGKTFALAEWDRQDRHHIVSYGEGEPTPQGFVQGIAALIGINAI